MKKLSNSFKTYCLTDTGRKREHNEDSSGIVVGKNFVILAVFDGMGGHKSGEVASRLALDTLKQEFSNLEIDKLTTFKAKKLLRQYLKDANEKIFSMSQKFKYCEGMGTTAVVGMIIDDETIVCNIGDSSAYMLKFKRKNIKKITVDQSYVEKLYERGKITKKEMRNHPSKNILTNALGISPTMHCDIKVIKNDFRVLMLCSDGLTNMVPESQISMILNRDMPVENKCLSLINRANDLGGIDNITVALYEREL